jgi:hypothetical protein
VRFQDQKGEAWTDYDSLIELITSTVQPQTWDVVGGPGSIAPMAVRGEDVIVLSQTQDVHDEIEALLGRLRSFDKDKSRDGELPVRARPEVPSGMGMGFGGMGGGMGGMGGGFGGMGGFGAPGGGAAPMQGFQGRPAASGKADLLRGLNEAQRRLQGEYDDSFQDQDSGYGGMGAGGIF